VFLCVLDVVEDILSKFPVYSVGVVIKGVPAGLHADPGMFIGILTSLEPALIVGSRDSHLGFSCSLTSIS
jgi:hypothetical protein